MNINDAFSNLVAHKRIFGDACSVIRLDDEIQITADEGVGIRVYFEEVTAEDFGPDMLIAEALDRELGSTVLFGTNHSDVAENILAWWEWATGPEND